MSDYYNIIDSAEKRAREEGHAEGHAEGLAEGLAKGREEERKEVAQKLLASGMTVESVAELLQIPVDRV